MTIYRIAHGGKVYFYKRRYLAELAADNLASVAQEEVEVRTWWYGKTAYVAHPKKVDTTKKPDFFIGRKGIEGKMRKSLSALDDARSKLSA